MHGVHYSYFRGYLLLLNSHIQWASYVLGRKCAFPSRRRGSWDSQVDLAVLMDYLEAGKRCLMIFISGLGVELVLESLSFEMTRFSFLFYRQ